MAKVYMYVVARDFGFAPNPFHGFCSLATCKPAIRSTAQVGDWILGMGGSALRAVGRCIFAMRVSETRSFDEYWADPTCRDKRPVRNGSKKMMVGDNIYHHDPDGRRWLQEDSHHSHADGTMNMFNLGRDTKTNRVLLSRHFFYFGAVAPPVPDEILDEIGYVNGRSHRVYPLHQCHRLIDWLEKQCADRLNEVMGDPFDFDRSSSRYSVETDRVS